MTEFITATNCELYRAPAARLAQASQDPRPLVLARVARLLWGDSDDQ